ncbi:MAG: glycosyltransferase family 39 protein [Gemmataceae bacterium]
MHDVTQDPSNGSRWLQIFSAAVLLTLLNVIKPVHEDDTVYLAYAAEFGSHPADPYGFQFGSPTLVPANNVLVPPVLPYWLGAGIKLFGDNPVLLKLWLFPFAILLAWSLHYLVSRLAPSVRTPVFCLALLSPTIVPGFNLMLDVPATSLGLAAVATAVRLLDDDIGRRRFGAAILAGLLAGVAVQTKYNAAMAATAVVALLILRRHWLLAVIAGATAVTCVVGWELMVAQLQGDSHFLIHFRQRQGRPLTRMMQLVLPLISHVAGLAPAIALLGMKAVGWSQRTIRIAGLMVVVAIAILALTPSQAPLLASQEGKSLLTLSNLVYGVLGIVIWPPLLLSCFRLARSRADKMDRSLDWFLLAWLLMELAGYYLLSPFPAARRLMGTLLVLTIVVGRLADRMKVPHRFVVRISACGVLLALVIQTADLYDARAGREAARQVLQTEHRPAAGGTFWHLSWSGFAYYADREGLKPLRFNQELPRVGDLVAVFDVPEFHASLANQRVIQLEQIDTIAVRDWFPLRAAPGYYDGRTPLENNHQARIRVLIYRVTSVSGKP